MSVDAHINQLQQKHQDLEGQLANLAASPSADFAEVKIVKQQKLKLKDEINRLQAQH